MERTRHLVQWGQQTYPHYDRFSVLSERDRDRIIQAFTPDELLYTDLLLRYPDSDEGNLTKAGRNIDADESKFGTVACTSGFAVNMCDRTVKLLTPTAADAEHPTGELLYEQAPFTDGRDFERVVAGMIDRHMARTLSLSDVISAG